MQKNSHGNAEPSKGKRITSLLRMVMFLQLFIFSFVYGYSSAAYWLFLLVAHLQQRVSRLTCA